MNIREKGRLRRLVQVLLTAHDALAGMADSDIEDFEDEEEELEAAPTQFAARKVMQAVQDIEGMLRSAS